MKIETGGGRPQRYKLADGTTVPSVTTICNRFKESGGLIQWAYKKGLEGKQLYEEVQEAGKIGGVVHDWIEQDILSEDCRQDLPQNAQARSGVEAWLKWKNRWIQSFTMVEMPLVSEQFAYGGTFDALGIESTPWEGEKQKIVLLDWKTSGAVYAENLVQLGAYALLLEECRGIAVEGYHLVRFSKEYSDLEHRHYDNLDSAKKLFLLYREAYGLSQELTKRAR